MGNSDNTEALLREWKERYWQHCSEKTKSQYTAIRRAIELTDAIERYETQLARKPVRKTAQPKYPNIKSTIKFSWHMVLVPIFVILLLSVLFPIVQFWLLKHGIFLYLDLFIPVATIGWIVFYYFVIYKPKKVADIERQRNSLQYRKQCAEIDEKTKCKQAELDEEYQKALREYNNAAFELAKVTRALNEHYAMTQVVPVCYRNRKALFYISVAILKTNNLEEAIALYEEECERQAAAQEQASEENTARGPGILSYLLRQSVDNATIRHNVGRTGKRDLMGQTGCARNYGGDCSDCNIRSGCARYFF